MKPRLAVFRSNKYLYAQIIDGGKTLAAVNKITDAAAGGREIAEKAIKAKVSEVVFDRGKNKYHGNIKKLADAARAGGLKF